MTDVPCTHLPDDLSPPPIRAKGCETCLDQGKRDWVHLRYCQRCGRVGCCNDSPGKHATHHARESAHPLIRSYEPNEQWFYCYLDDAAFSIRSAPPAASYDD